MNGETAFVKWRPDDSWHIVDESVTEPGEVFTYCGRIIHQTTLHREVPQGRQACGLCRERHDQRHPA